MNAIYKFVGLSVLCWCLFPAPRAAAFDRSQDPATGVCLWWNSREIVFHINEKCSSEVPQQQCIAAVQAAFDTWAAASCSDIRFVYGGTTTRDDVGYDPLNLEDNINLVVWQESDWPDFYANAVALAKITYDSSSGEIVDADIQLNASSFVFSVTGEPDTINIQNAMTHELGHVLGLDHSDSAESCMYFSAELGSIDTLDLAEDDIQAVCHLYPRGEESPRCETFVPEEIEPEASAGSGGCNQTGSQGISLLLLFLMPFILRCRT